MSAQLRCRALQEGRVKALRRMKQPMRDVRPAGQYIPSRGAQRRADRMALQALLRRDEDCNE